MRKLLMAFVMVLAVASLANAASITLTNGGFENPDVANASATNAYWTGWNCSGVASGSNTGFATRDPDGTETGSPKTATEGFQFGMLDRAASIGPQAWQQTVVIAANTLYTLKFDIAGLTASTENEWVNGLIYSSSTSGVLGTQIGGFTDSLSGGTSGVSDYAWYTDRTATFDSSGIGSSQVGKYLQIVFQGGRVAIDNVRLDATAVPEPATMAILGLGSLFLARRRKA